MSPLHPEAKDEVLKYIGEMPDFSRAICTKLRTIILRTDKKIVEDWKWGPNYNYEGMICGYGAFKSHVKLTFFNGSGMKDSRKLFNHCVDNQFSRSIKFTDVSEIDEKALTEYVKDSMSVNAKGFKRVVSDKTVVVPEDLDEALAKNKKAASFFNHLSYGYRKDFVAWVTTAKRSETRLDRIAKTVNMCIEGRKLNDQYK